MSSGEEKKEEQFDLFDAPIEHFNKKILREIDGEFVEDDETKQLNEGE